MNDSQINKPCSVCKVEYEPDDLRPYGKDGADLCFQCGMKPEHFEEAKRRINARLDVCGNNVAFLHSGPEALTAENANKAFAIGMKGDRGGEN